MFRPGDFLHFDAGTQAFTARVPAEQAGGLHDLARGAPVNLNFHMGQAHLFDAESGLALT